MKKTQQFFSLPSDSVFYRDLRPFEDDNTVLQNPHKGWYLHYVDNGLVRKEYRDDIASAKEIADIPGLKFLYLRLDWSDTERSEGKFDFSFIKDTMDEYGRYGFKFMFRFCCFETIGGGHTATPKWLFDKGIGFSEVGETLEPDYGDPVFLKCAARWLKKLGELLDGDERVESVDIGTFGTWGEGHTFAGSLKRFSFETVKEHIDMHLRAFPKTKININYDLILHIFKQNEEQGKWIADYAALCGCGIRCDSVNVDSYVNDFGFDTLSTPDLYEKYNGESSVDIEFAHYSIGGAESFKNGYRHIEALKKSGATYAGFHGYITRWLSEQSEFHNYIANRLGYWFIPEGYLLPPLLSGTSAVLTLFVENRGFAKSYYPYTVKIVLNGENGERYTVTDAPAGNTEWQSGKLSKAAYKLDLTFVPQGRYNVELGLFEGKTPIKLGLDASLKTPDGYYTLGTAEVG